MIKNHRWACKNLILYGGGELCTCIFTVICKRNAFVVAPIGIQIETRVSPIGRYVGS